MQKRLASKLSHILDVATCLKTFVQAGTTELPVKVYDRLIARSTEIDVTIAVHEAKTKVYGSDAQTWLDYISCLRQACREYEVKRVH